MRQYHLPLEIENVGKNIKGEKGEGNGHLRGRKSRFKKKVGVGKNIKWGRDRNLGEEIQI